MQPPGINTGQGDPTQPTDGDWCAVTGFDGGGPGVISLAQDVSVPKQATTLMFDYRVGWSVSAGSEDRRFQVLVRPEGGGAPLLMQHVRWAENGTSLWWSDPVSASLDLSAFRGQTVRVSFEWWVPEVYTGPASCHLDDVRFVGKRSDPVDAGSLQIKLRFAKVDGDAVKLQGVVPVQQGFVPTAQPLTVRVGDLQREVLLDSKGRGQTGDTKVKLSEDKQLPGHQRLQVTIKGGSYRDELAPWGLDDASTVAGGETRQVPVVVWLDGLETVTEECALWVAKAGKLGVAQVQHRPELMPVGLALRLDRDAFVHDQLALRTVAHTRAGWMPDGKPLRVRIGSWDRTYELDFLGSDLHANEAVLVQRDKQVPTLQRIRLACDGVDLSMLTWNDGFVDDDVGKPGLALQPEIYVTLDGLDCQPLMDLTYRAKSGTWGKPKGKL